MRVYGSLFIAILCLGGFLAHDFVTRPLPDRAVAGERQIAVVERRFAELEPQIHQKEISLNHMYGQLLQTNGRLLCKSIISGNTSRLVLADVTLRNGQLARGGEGGVSRAYMRDEGSFDITLPSAVTAYELDLAFEGTPLYGLGAAFVQAEMRTGINAVFLSAIAVIESNYGNSALASAKNNLFGFGAYDGSPDSAQSFSSKRECIFTVARFLREHYIDGSYYRGHSIQAINQLYASDSAWSNKVFEAMCRIDQVIRQKMREM